ncbi:MAG: peptide chain release factor 3 [Acidobacteria bacterium]|nr:peptide chain release factor 3 [Acidobacteriota bacterium]
MSTVQPTTEELAAQVAKRRTFAIISHPDAGKSTLTEKILLYAGAIELAGAVRGRKSRRHVVSDWMEMEQQRGISLTSTALEFDLDGFHVSLLDTPGHQDFSEDTYRALIAADSVVMVIDAAKGIEAQTRKLFEVCKRDRLPILTFVNKLDQPGRDPLELLDEIETTLGISAAPLNWPVGVGADFRGVFDLPQRTVLLYERSGKGERPAPVEVQHHHDPRLADLVGERVVREFQESVEIIASAGTTFDQAEYLAGRQTGVLFGSALANFGLEPFLDALTAIAPPPRARQSDVGLIDPASPDFTGFVFKIQANMDRRHRDRVAFVRVCSGRLMKDMLLTNGRLGQQVRAARTYRMFGRERQTSNEAVAGDIVGLVNPGRFAIGDSLYEGRPVRFTSIPRFPAEHFGRLRLNDSRHKQFDDGVRQLEEEGSVQVLFPKSGGRDPVVAVVGSLQFDVIASRLRTEYNVEARVEPLSYHCSRRVYGPPEHTADLKGLDYSVMQTLDREGRLVLLFPSAWALQYAERQNPDVRFVSTPD